MNYYKRHLGDYAKKAGHLSTWEHGAYTLILDAYYDRELAPTLEEAFMFSRAKKANDKRTVIELLAQFFAERDGRWYQQRVEDELERYRAISEHNSAAGKLGGRPPRARKIER